MESREYLKNIALIDAQIDGTLADIQRWYDRATSITQQPKTIVKLVDGKLKKTVVPPSFGAGVSDKVGDSVSEYVDIEMETDLKNLLTQRQQMIDLMRQLKNKDQFTVLWESYVMNRSNKEIADRMDRSQTWVSTIKQMALDALDKILAENV
jgi:DNA-directed RNA polymerase specialized sigma24 family protein